MGKIGKRWSLSHGNAKKPDSSIPQRATTRKRRVVNSLADMGRSARAHDKIIRVARTIADMDGSDNTLVDHLHEAINYRMLDRQIWT